MPSAQLKSSRRSSPVLPSLPIIPLPWLSDVASQTLRDYFLLAVLVSTLFAGFRGGHALAVGCLVFVFVYNYAKRQQRQGDGLFSPMWYNITKRQEAAAYAAQSKALESCSLEGMSRCAPRLSESDRRN